MASGGHERRRHTRYACDAVAEVVAIESRALFRGRVRDLSESGCFVETRAGLKLDVMARVELHIHMRGLQMSALAYTRSIHPGLGAGFEFVSRDPRLQQPLQKMIEQIRAGSAPDEPRWAFGGADSRR